MNHQRAQIIGTTLVLAAGVMMWIGAERAVPTKVAAKAAPAEDAIGAAHALGDAFASVAERVKPCVVSVHSEKSVKIRRFEWQFPFGEESPFKWLFERQQPGEKPRRSPQREYKFHQGGLGSGIVSDKDGHRRPAARRLGRFRSVARGDWVLAKRKGASRFVIVRMK